MCLEFGFPLFILHQKEGVNDTINWCAYSLTDAQGKRKYCKLTIKPPLIPLP